MPGATRMVATSDVLVSLRQGGFATALPTVQTGRTFVGPDTSDFLQAATIAIVGEVPLEKLWHAVPSFPTRSEVWLKLLEAYGL